MSVYVSLFKPSRSGLQIFLDRYQYLLSIFVTFVFFAEVPDYLGDESNILPINTLAWIIGCLILSLPFVGKIKTMPKPLVIAIGIYLLISILSFATLNANEASFQELRKRVLSVTFVCMMYILYEQRSLKQVQYAILAAVLMAIFNNFVELANPGIFSALNVGRPAGFYVNPTKTACALVLGMIFTINLIGKPYRWLYVLLIGIGILPTFTRGAILAWVICVAVMISRNYLSNKRRTVIIPTLILIAFLVVVNPLQLMSNYFSGGIDGSYSNVLDRLDQFQNPSVEDQSAKDRANVAKYAWKMFGDNPFWGHGLGSTHQWTVANVSTHNMYLYYMVDHGVIGLIFLPGVIFAVVYRNRGEEKTIIICYAIFMGLWGMFSHSVLDERYILLTFSLLAAMNNNQRQYSQYFANKFQLALPPAKSQLLLPPVRNQRALPPADYRKIFPPIDR